MPTSLLYALVIVYVIIAIFAFLLLTMPPLFGGAPKMGWGKGFMVAASWPLIAAGMPFVYVGSFILSYSMEPTEEERRKLREQDARLRLEQAEIDAANAKMVETNAAALREKQVAQVTEIKTAATTVPAEPAAVVTTEATPAK